MAGGATPNPYGANTPQYAGQYSNVSDYGSPDAAYAVPDAQSDAPYIDEFGWSPHPRISVGNTPDAMRLGDFPTRTMRPGAAEAPGVYYRPLDADDKERHSVEDQDADGWTEKKDQYKIGPDPRWNPPAETRITEQLAPRSYSFTRPFDQGSKGNGARALNGTHLSMADHRRDYEILGMQPWAPRRNTYRADPAPWDADLYDVPPASDMGVSTQARIQAVDFSRAPNGSFRLG